MVIKKLGFLCIFTEEHWNTEKPKFRLRKAATKIHVNNKCYINFIVQVNLPQIIDYRSASRSSLIMLQPYLSLPKSNNLHFTLHAASCHLFALCTFTDPPLPSSVKVFSFFYSVPWSGLHCKSLFPSPVFPTILTTPLPYCFNL